MIGQRAARCHTGPGGAGKSAGTKTVACARSSRRRSGRHLLATGRANRTRMGRNAARRMRPTAGSSTGTSGPTTPGSNCACARRTPSRSGLRTVALCVAPPPTTTGSPRILDVGMAIPPRQPADHHRGRRDGRLHTRSCTCCATPARCGASSTVRRERDACAKTLVCGWITGCLGSGRSAERCHRTRRCRRKGRRRRSPRQRRWRDPMRRSCRWHRVASR